MNKKFALKTVSIKDLWKILRKSIVLIIVVAVACTAFMYFRAKSNYVPMYSSTATLYLLGEHKADEEGNINVNYALAGVVVDDSLYLLTSRTVLDKVGENIGIKNGYNALKGRVTVENPENTRVIEITAVANTPEKAKDIVDNICVVGTESINLVLAYDQMRIFEKGTFNPNPVNAVSLMSSAKYGILAGAAVYIIFLILFLLDTYIRTEDDIEHYLGVTVLGNIPNTESGKKGGKKPAGKKKPTHSPKTNGGAK